MTASYAGAEAAIFARFRENWNRTPIAEPNGPEIATTDGSGDQRPWVYIEVEGSGSNIKGVGKPGEHAWEYLGVILIHVFVPTGTGTALAAELAAAAGEIFRAAEFYRAAPGCCVRSWSPRVDRGSRATDDLSWWRVTAAIPFEYLHRG